MTPAREPVRYLSIGVAIIVLALPHLRTFGVPLTPEQVEALSDFLPAALLVLGGEVVRSRVTPTRSLP